MSREGATRMPYVQENKNGAAAPLSSIKDRIKSFEFMKTSGTTSPRTRSPVPFHNESTGTLRRTGTSLERDGNERRQMRRSERREAELRRENEMLALKAKEKPNNQPNEVSQNTEIQSAEGPTTESAPHQTPERHVPRVTPRVIPREKDKPPEPAFRRRRNENKAWDGNEKDTHGTSSVHHSVSSEKPPSSQTTESSSNEAIDVNSSEEPADISSVSSEETEESKEKESEEEGEQVEEDGNDEDTGEEDVDEEYDEESEEDEKNSATEEDEKQQDNDEGQIDTDEDTEGQETEEARTEEEQESSEDENEDEMVAEPQKRGNNSLVSEQPKRRREKIVNHGNSRKTSRQHHRDSNGPENLNGVNHSHGHKKDKRDKDIGVSERRGSSHERRTKQQQQQQSSISGSESGDVKLSRHQKNKGSIQSETTPESSKEIKTKQHRRHNSGSGNNLANVRAEQPQKTTEVSAGKADFISEKAKKDEHNNRSLVRTKSIPKGARRSGSRNSLKSIPAEVVGELTTKQTGSKSRQPTRKDDGEGNTLSGQNSRKASYAEDEGSEEAGTENEVISLSSQLNLYSNNVFGLVPPSIQSSMEAESEGTSSPDLKHDELPSKKAFVCAIHEEPCKYYCQDCERLICSECAMRWGDCHEHYYLRVKDAWKKYREEMMKILQEARSSVSHIQQDILENSKERDSFKLKVESTIKKINSFFDEHVQALEKRRTNFLETVEEVMKFREIGINQEIDSLQNNLVETNSTINVAGRVYGTSTMMEFLQVCKQLTNRLLELGKKKIKLNITESIDIDFISEPNLFDEIEKVGELKKHNDPSATKMFPDAYSSSGTEAKMRKNDMEMVSNVHGPKKVDENEQDSMDSVVGTSTENLSESTSAKDTNDAPRQHLIKNSEQRVPQSGFIQSPSNVNDQTIERHNMKSEIEEPVKMKSNEELEAGTNFGQQATPGVKSGEPVVKQEITAEQRSRYAANGLKAITEYEIADCSCPQIEADHRNGLPSDDVERMAAAEIPVKQKPTGDQHARRHSMDDVLGIRSSKKEEIQRRLGNMGRYRPPKSVSQFLDEGERYFSSGEAEQRRRKQDYYKVRFNDRAYYSNPSDSSELEEMRGYDFEERPVKHKVRRHRTMPLIRPITERRELKSPWALDVFRYHGKIHFSRNGLKATGKAFGWNAVVGSHGFSQGKHTWKVRVTKWTAVGVCYKDDHVDNPSWGAGNKWTWDSADMCYSPRLGVCESPVGEWIDGDVIALELDCDNSVLVVHNLRTSETDKLYGFKEPVYPYFYLSVFRSISLVEIDGIQVGS